jgi:hypothetical protein
MLPQSELWQLARLTKYSACCLKSSRPSNRSRNVRELASQLQRTTQRRARHRITRLESDSSGGVAVLPTPSDCGCEVCTCERLVAPSLHTGEREQEAATALGERSAAALASQAASAPSALSLCGSHTSAGRHRPSGFPLGYGAADSDHNKGGSLLRLSQGSWSVVECTKKVIVIGCGGQSTQTSESR